MTGPKKPEPYQDAIMRGQTGVKYEKPEIQEVAKTKLKQVNSTLKTLSNAIGVVFNPAAGIGKIILGAVKNTPMQKHDKQYFNADNAGRIVTINPTTGKQENASTSLYAGMNRVSLKGNLESAGAKRIATREKAIAKGNVSQKFINDTNNMRDQQNDYRKSKNI